jgi:PEP-CTERM motif
MKRFHFLPLWLLAGLSVYAAPLTVTNPNFDDDVLADGANTCSGVGGFTGWTSLGGGCGTGLNNPNTSMFPGGAAHSGDNVAYLNGAVGYWQALPELYVPGTFTFALQVGERLDVQFGGYVLELHAGPTYAGASSLLASFASSVSPGAGLFGPASVSHTVNPGDAAIGQQVLIAFRGNGVQTSFDTVTVDAQVPEPGTYALLGSALVGLAWMRRRR